MSDNATTGNQDELVFGRNAVLSCLENCRGKGPVNINKVFLADGLESDRKLDSIKALARQLKVPVVFCDRRKLDQMAGDKMRHQGVVAQMSPTELLELDDWLNSLAPDLSGDPSGIAVALIDGIEDPHNLGAIIRSAEAAGFRGILIPARRAAVVTGVVLKTSAGAAATLPIVRVTNLVAAMERLKEAGFWIAGMDVKASQNHFASDLKGPLAIVVGSEGTGMSRLTAKNCDFLVKIPMLGETESLNASVAAGVVFYEFVRQKLSKSPLPK